MEDNNYFKTKAVTAGAVVLSIITIVSCITVVGVIQTKLNRVKMHVEHHVSEFKVSVSKFTFLFFTDSSLCYSTPSHYH